MIIIYKGKILSFVSLFIFRFYKHISTWTQKSIILIKKPTYIQLIILTTLISRPMYIMYLIGVAVQLKSPLSIKWNQLESIETSFEHALP